jgi:hypothetical protein
MRGLAPHRAMTPGEAVTLLAGTEAGLCRDVQGTIPAGKPIKVS